MTVVYCLEGAVTGGDHRGHAIAGNRPLRSIREDLCQSEGVVGAHVAYIIVVVSRTHMQTTLIHWKK